MVTRIEIFIHLDSFCMAHTLAYSLVGLQELNLAYKYPIIFWNTANLIVDSGSMNLSEEFESCLDDSEDFSENEDEEDEKKVKNSSADYGRIATAIGKMKREGLSFTCPDINKSDVTFVPDLKNDTIIYGLRGITRIGNQLIKDILKNRPFLSMKDFLTRIKVNKTQMINLIKAGTFDSFYNSREEAMEEYISLIADKKNTVNLRNMMMLIKYKLLPPELEQEIKIFNFNKYLKSCKSGDDYMIDHISFPFYCEHFDTDLLKNVVVDEGISNARIFQSDWDRLYKKAMEPVRIYLKQNLTKVLNDLNNILLEEVKQKYAEGNLSKWEMDSLSFYYHEHELENLREDIYEISNFFELSEEPEVDYEFSTKDGKKITMYKLSRISGTVIDKNKNKGTVILLTKYGVVSVKIWKNQFSAWDKRISEVGSDGKKHVVEESWFKRGTKLIVTGIRRENNFVPKKYKNTQLPLFEKIIELDDKGFVVNSAKEREE